VSRVYFITSNIDIAHATLKEILDLLDANFNRKMKHPITSSARSQASAKPSQAKPSPEPSPCSPAKPSPEPSPCSPAKPSFEPSPEPSPCGPAQTSQAPSQALAAQPSQASSQLAECSRCPGFQGDKASKKLIDNFTKNQLRERYHSYRPI
jgi:hypothetical protein